MHGCYCANELHNTVPLKLNGGLCGLAKDFLYIALIKLSICNIILKDQLSVYIAPARFAPSFCIIMLLWSCLALLSRTNFVVD